MSALANASAEEARHIIEEFVDSVFTEHPDDPFADRMRAALPDLPEAPSDEQIDAWIELASLVADGDFRARVRHMIAEGSRQRARTGISDVDEPTQRAGEAVVERAGAVLDQGITNGSPEADPIVTDLVDGFAKTAQRNGDPAYRQELLDQLETFSDTRVERYWQLIGVINGWPARDSMSPAYAWFIAALRARSE